MQRRHCCFPGIYTIRRIVSERTLLYLQNTVAHTESRLYNRLMYVGRFRLRFLDNLRHFKIIFLDKILYVSRKVGTCTIRIV